MFKKIKAGVINMARQITENESRIVEAKCDLTKYCIDKTVDCIGKIGNLNPKKVGVVVMGLGVGLGVGLYIAGCIK